jgi:preprotein translocase subunit SecA
VQDFESLEITPEGVDWERAGLRGPSATWTYLVGENPFGASGLLSPAGRTGMGLAAAAVPFLVVLQGLGLAWKRRRARRRSG